MTIAPGEIADPMTVHDKVVGGLIDSVSLFSATGWIAAAGWEQLWNGSPNYGTDSGAFGQRLGAATLRGISEGVFSNSLFAPTLSRRPALLHHGRGPSLLQAARLRRHSRNHHPHRQRPYRHPTSRSSPATPQAPPSPSPTIPAKNTTFSEVAQTFGGSIGGSALGFVVDEFIVDALDRPSPEEEAAATVGPSRVLWNLGERGHSECVGC